MQDMRYFDLRKLLKGQALNTRITLFKNRASYNILALLNSGANGYCFINHSFLKSLSYFLKLLIHSLLLAVLVKGYNNRAGHAISYYTTLNLTVDGRVQSFTPFLITHLGNYRVIIRRL